jgi:hypothetical protein
MMSFWGIYSFKDAMMAATPFVTMGVLWATIRMTKGLKKTDTLISFGQRFNELMMFRHALDKRVNDLENLAGAAFDGAKASLKADALNYYRQHFDLQFNEFYAFRKGLLDREIFTLWMRTRARQFATDCIGATYYEEGWKYWRTGWRVDKQDAFTRFMIQIHGCVAEGAHRKDLSNAELVSEAKRVIKTVKQHAPWWRWWWRLNLAPARVPPQPVAPPPPPQ